MFNERVIPKRIKGTTFQPKKKHLDKKLTEDDSYPVQNQYRNIKAF